VGPGAASNSTAIQILAALLLALGFFALGRMHRAAEARTSDNRPSSPLASEADRPRPERRAVTRDSRQTGPIDAGTGTTRADEALGSLLASAPAVERRRAWIEALRSFTSEDFAATWRVLEGFDPRERGGVRNRLDSEIEIFLAAWAGVDPKRATESLLLSQSRFQLRRAGDIRSVLSSWAVVDPDGVIEWIESESGDPPIPLNRDTSIANALLGFDRSNIDQATVLLESIDPRRAGRPTESLAASFGDDLTAAQDWALSLGTEELRQLAIDAVAERVAMVDPSTAAAWLLAQSDGSVSGVMNEVVDSAALGRGRDDEFSRDQLEQARSRFERMAGVMADWAAGNPSAADAYYRSIADPALRSAALTGIVQRKAAEEPRAALYYLRANAGDVTPKAAYELTKTLASRQPALALEAAILGGDDPQLERLAGITVRNWFVRDPNVAESWYASNRGSLNRNLAETFEEQIERPADER